MKRIILTVLLFLFTLNSLISQNIIDTEYSLDENNGYYTFSCINHDLCNYIVEINFSYLGNLKSDVFLPYKGEVRPGRNRLFQLKPINSFAPTSFNYSYSYCKGCIDPNVNLNFIYLLPIRTGKETEVFELKYAKVNPQEIEPKDWYMVGFKMNYQDTIYAARRGTVISLRDTAKLKLSGYRCSTEDNFIEILHDDCSIGNYQVLSRVLVKLGQAVNAGDPIGIAGGEKYSNGYQVRFFVNYNYEQKKPLKNNDRSSIKTSQAFIPLVFYTKGNKANKLIYGNTYTSDHPDSLIILEMSKREIKKWLKNKNTSLDCN